MERSIYGNGADTHSRKSPVDVDDALQFSPLSSVVPFAAGKAFREIFKPTVRVTARKLLTNPMLIAFHVAESIPVPLLKTSGASHTFPDRTEREQARHLLDTLNAQADADPHSRVVGKYLGEVASLINSDELTE